MVFKFTSISPKQQKSLLEIFPAEQEKPYPSHHSIQFGNKIGIISATHVNFAYSSVTWETGYTDFSVSYTVRSREP